MGYHSLLQGNLPDPGIKSESPALQADVLLSEPPWKYCLLIGYTLIQNKKCKEKKKVKKPTTFGVTVNCHSSEPGRASWPAYKVTQGAWGQGGSGGQGRAHRTLGRIASQSGSKGESEGEC